jgi:hypothetical protein
MPVEADDSGVITQIAPGGPQNRRAERVNEFTGMHVPATSERLRNEPLGRCVPASHRSRTRFGTSLQRELLQPKRSARLQPEGEINVEFDLLDPTLPQPQRERVPGVHNQRIAGMEVHTQQLPDDELTRRCMHAQRIVGVTRLLAEISTSTTFIAQASHQQSGEQRGRWSS